MMVSAKRFLFFLLVTMGTVRSSHGAKSFGSSVFLQSQVAFAKLSRSRLPEMRSKMCLDGEEASSVLFRVRGGEQQQQQEEETNMRVLIVGAGLAGLSTALSLVTKNDRIQVTLVECRSDLASRGATFGLNLNGHKALEELAPLGVLEKFKDEGVFMPATGGYMLPWWRVRDVLLEEARKFPDRIQIHLGESIDDVHLVEENSGGSSQHAPLVATFQNSDLRVEADVVIGADGVHSYVRTDILKLPPARPTQAFVWRGSVDTNTNTNSSTASDLKQFQEYPFSKADFFGDFMVVNYFNFHQKVDGSMAWVFSVRANCLPKSIPPIEPGTTTPKDLVQAFMESVEEPDEELKEKYATAMLAFENTHNPSDLMWSSEMNVVDLTQKDIGWGGKGRITLIGDAAHACRPNSGLGGGLAFEDAALLGRYLAKCCTADDDNKDDDDTACSIETQLRAFEKYRLPRCRSISNDQSIRSELSYKLGFMAVPQWDPEYSKWISGGIDSPPEPPVSEMDVFSALLSN